MTARHIIITVEDDKPPSIDCQEFTLYETAQIMNECYLAVETELPKPVVVNVRDR